MASIVIDGKVVQLAPGVDPAYAQDILYRYEYAKRAGQDPYGLDRDLADYERELQRITGGGWTQSGSGTRTDSPEPRQSTPSGAGHVGGGTDAPPAVIYVPGTSQGIPTEMLWLAGAALLVMLVLRR